MKIRNIGVVIVMIVFFVWVRSIYYWIMQTFGLSEIQHENLSQPNIIKEGLGEDRAKAIFGSLKAVNLVDQKNLTALEAVDPKVLAEFLVEEHPQTIALVVAHMDLNKQIATFEVSRSIPHRSRHANGEFGICFTGESRRTDELLEKRTFLFGSAEPNQYWWSSRALRNCQ